VVSISREVSELIRAVALPRDSNNLVKDFATFSRSEVASPRADTMASLSSSKIYLLNPHLQVMRYL
jgi:hypothetical protein